MFVHFCICMYLPYQRCSDFIWTGVVFGCHRWRQSSLTPSPWRLHHKPATSQLTESLLPVFSYSYFSQFWPVAYVQQIILTPHFYGKMALLTSCAFLSLHGLPLLHTLRVCCLCSPEESNAKLTNSFSVNTNQSFKFCLFRGEVNWGLGADSYGLLFFTTQSVV